MARTTLTQKLEILDTKLAVLDREVARQGLLVDVNLERYQELLKDAKEREAKLQAQVVELTLKVAGLEEKTRMLEKLSDRGWQVWLAIFGAGLALLVAVLKH